MQDITKLQRKEIELQKEVAKHIENDPDMIRELSDKAEVITKTRNSSAFLDDSLRRLYPQP